MNEINRNDKQELKYPENLSLTDLCEVYLKIIFQSKREGGGDWNSSIDQLLQIYQTDPSALKNDVVRLWNENPEIIISFLEKTRHSGKIYNQGSGIEIKTGPEEFSIIKEIDTELSEEKEKNFILDILGGRIKGVSI